MFKKITDFIKELYPNKQPLPLHEPVFPGKEKEYLLECLRTTMVSSVGPFVSQFENEVCKYTGSKYAVATTNGTSALHIALKLVGVESNTEVLTQALTFVATANAISYCHAFPVFIDSESDSLGLCPVKLKKFLVEETEKRADGVYNKKTGRKIVACVPMHVFGHSVKIQQIISICDSFGIKVIEDAAEALGSFSEKKHLGTFAPIGVLSFNGNKVITTGGGGMLLLQDEALAKKAKHLTTTAKISHAWEFFHDEVGYNYRLPNLNAAMGCAQMELLPGFIKNKRETAKKYEKFFGENNISFLKEPAGTESNYWLNAIFLKDRAERDQFLQYCHDEGILARPVWRLMPDLPAFKDCSCTDLSVARNISDRLVNLPSSVRL